jgi:dipeptidyl aminopeptidase/acylaminoacyl peptidase
LKGLHVTVKGYDFAQYLNVRAFHGASFSPDGRTLSFLANITGVDEVWSIPIEMQGHCDRLPVQLTLRGERVVAATFSPQDDTLLIAGDVGGNERIQLYLLHADSSHLIELTERPEVIHFFGGWSPDGTHITYSSNERDPRFLDVYERHLASGTVTRLFQQNGTNHVIGYSPDGELLLIAQHLSNVNNRLLLVRRATGAVETLTADAGCEHAVYCAAEWSTGGRGLYMLGNYGRQFFSLAYLDLATREMSYLTDYSWDIKKLALTCDGGRMALITNEDGYSRLELFDVSEGWQQRRTLMTPTLPMGVIEELTWSRDGTRLAITLNCATNAPGIWIWDVEESTLRQVTPNTSGILCSSFIAPTLIRYPTFDGRAIPAFLYLPHEKQKQLPIVIHLHGGPAGQALPAFNPIVQYLAAHGYGVLAPNVRGSSGYGHEYESLDDVYLRMDAVEDLHYAALWLKEQGIADPHRIAVMGGSYGGFMVLAAVTTYPELWAAGIDIVGIANFVTYLENTGPWRRKMRESEYGSLEHDREFLTQISPIHAADRIVAPMFIVHGANDVRVPIEEAEQIVAALRAHKVPVEYLRFEDEGHGLVKRANRLIAYPAIACFLQKHLSASLQKK